MTKILEAVSTPTRGQARGTAGRAPAPPMTVSEAGQRVVDADGAAKWPAVVDWVETMVREPMAEYMWLWPASRSASSLLGESSPLPGLIKRSIKFCVGARAPSSKRPCKWRVSEWTKQWHEAYRREYGDHFMRQLEAYPKNGPRRSHEITTGNESMRFTTGANHDNPQRTTYSRPRSRCARDEPEARPR